MKTPENFNSTIKFLADIFKDYQYAFRGTSSLVLHGLDMNVDDIDVLCDERAALSANKLLEEYLTHEVEWSESEKFKSFFGKFKVNGILVEVIGDWQIKDLKGDWSRVYDASEFEELNFEGEKVKVTPVNLELECFAKMGRWSAFHKVKKQMKTNFHEDKLDSDKNKNQLELGLM